jgi:hypothetical protein
MFADVRGGLRRGIDASSADRQMRTAAQRVHDRSRFGRRNAWRLTHGGCVSFEWPHRPSSIGTASPDVYSSERHALTAAVRAKDDADRNDG